MMAINPMVIDAKLAAYAMYTTYGLDPLPFDELRTQGVDCEALAKLDVVIVKTACTFYSEGDFDFDDLGEISLAFAIVGEDGETEQDIVAWPARQPDRLGLYFHRAPVVGAWNLTNPASFYGGKALPLWRTPLRWLQEDCAGGVVLQPIAAAPMLARAPGQFIAEDVDHARELVKTGTVTRNQIVVAVPERRAA